MTSARRPARTSSGLHRITLLTGLLAVNAAILTASEPEPPRSFSLKPESLGRVESRVLSEVDGERLLTEARAADANRATKPGPYRFAEPIELTYCNIMDYLRRAVLESQHFTYVATLAKAASVEH